MRKRSGRAGPVEPARPIHRSPAVVKRSLLEFSLGGCDESADDLDGLVVEPRLYLGLRGGEDAGRPHAPLAVQGAGLRPLQAATQVRVVCFV